jgi:hypothetical protein
VAEATAVSAFSLTEEQRRGLVVQERDETAVWPLSGGYALFVYVRPVRR